jgi:hypothetical protein
MERLQSRTSMAQQYGHISLLRDIGALVPLVSSAFFLYHIGVERHSAVWTYRSGMVRVKPQQFPKGQGLGTTGWQGRRGSFLTGFPRFKGVKYTAAAGTLPLRPGDRRERRRTRRGLVANGQGQGGGEMHASVRWRTRRVITDAWVLVAMSRSELREHKDRWPDAGHRPVLRECLTVTWSASRERVLPRFSSLSTGLA